MQEEMQSLHDNEIFELVKLPKIRRALTNRWIYKIKHEEHSEFPRYKARLVVKGFNPKKGVYFVKIFSPVVTMAYIRAVLSLAVSYDLEVEQMDVKIMFLHGELEEEIYMRKP